ncbi:Lipase GDSL [Neofusicoccum parvum]|nr:Lipase GDSL [Neofusicoccum parvum]
MSHRTAVPLSSALSAEDLSSEVKGESLSKKNVLITGGASGVGAAIAQAYAEKGAYVTIVDINEDLGNQHTLSLQSQGHHVQFIRTDIASWPSQVAAFKAAIRFHPAQTLDTVIACAGVLGQPFLLPSEGGIRSLADDPPCPDTSTWAVNAVGLNHTTKLAQLYFELPGAVAPAPRRPKSLVVFASLLSYIDFPNAVAYTGSKYAARGLFRIARDLFAQRGHRVNAVAPWLTRTPMTPDLVALFESVGCPFTEGTDLAVRACLRLDGDDGVNGRVLAAGPDRIFDMQDDLEGKDGAKGLEYFYGQVMPDWTVYLGKMREITMGSEH